MLIITQQGDLININYVNYYNYRIGDSINVNYVNYHYKVGSFTNMKCMLMLFLCSVQNLQGHRLTEELMTTLIMMTI